MCATARCGARCGLLSVSFNHFGRKTANARFGRWRYEWGSNVAVVQGLRQLHGWGTAFTMMRAIGPAYSRKWCKEFPARLCDAPPRGLIHPVVDPVTSETRFLRRCQVTGIYNPQ